jgi:hypothetical protein
MKNDFEHISVAFHNRAKEALFSLYGSFRYAVASIDRQGDENVFQQLHDKFSSRLKHQLESIAKEMLSQADSGSNINELNQSLSYFIQGYMHEFSQKIRSL